MTFTRKHYEAIAHLLDANMASEAIVLDFCDMFSEDNPNFRADLFIPAATNMIRLSAERLPSRLTKYLNRK
jgi:hypothetical protein